MMELVVMRDSKSRVARREGSTPSPGTKKISKTTTTPARSYPPSQHQNL